MEASRKRLPQASDVIDHRDIQYIRTNKKCIIIEYDAPPHDLIASSRDDQIEKVVKKANVETQTYTHRTKNISTMTESKCNFTHDALVACNSIALQTDCCNSDFNPLVIQIKNIVENVKSNNITKSITLEDCLETEDEKSEQNDDIDNISLKSDDFNITESENNIKSNLDNDELKYYKENSSGSSLIQPNFDNSELSRNEIWMIMYNLVVNFNNIHGKLPTKTKDYSWLNNQLFYYRHRKFKGTNSYRNDLLSKLIE